jgi:hypothetical protein
MQFSLPSPACGRGEGEGSVSAAAPYFTGGPKDTKNSGYGRFMNRPYFVFFVIFVVSFRLHFACGFIPPGLRADV